MSLGPDTICLDSANLFQPRSCISVFRIIYLSSERSTHNIMSQKLILQGKKVTMRILKNWVLASLRNQHIEYYRIYMDTLPLEVNHTSLS